MITYMLKKTHNADNLRVFCPALRYRTVRYGPYPTVGFLLLFLLGGDRREAAALSPQQLCFAVFHALKARWCAICLARPGLCRLTI